MLRGTHHRPKDRLRSLTHFGEGVVLARRMQRDGITHIHAHFASQAASVARVVHLLTGIPYSFTGHAHDIWQDRILLPEKIQEARFVTTCSRMGKRYLVLQAPPGTSEKIHVVYHGLDVQAFPYIANGEEREKNLILSVGRLTAQKGFPDLIKACAILKSRSLHFRCIIIGQGEDKEQLRGQIESEGLAGTVTLQGAVAQERIKEYYRRAWVFALPCVDTADGNRDGIPNVLMESMAMGLPVVTTTNSGQPELIRDGRDGLLVPVHSPVVLANAIERLFDDGELRERIRTEARRRMEDAFDCRKTIEPLVDLFCAHVPELARKAGTTREGQPGGRGVVRTGMRGRNPARPPTKAASAMPSRK
jgi:glycosyltransferase involved in cell wall biosynthesis